MDVTQEVQVTGAEVASLFDPRSEETLTQDERVVLAGLLNRDDRVDLAIPDEMDARELWRTLEICSRVFLRVRHASGQLKLLIGRALHVIHNTPDVYKSRGFSSFDDFMTREDGLPRLTGISRAELYKAKSVAASLGPQTNMDDIREIGSFTKLQLIAGYTEAGSNEQNALMEAAKHETIQQLKERIARSELQVEVEDLTWDVLQVNVTRAQKQQIWSFISNPQVKAYCESEAPGVILQRAIEECCGEWQVQPTAIEGEAEAV